ncbi:MAG: TonB-dependent siderophore receptor [Kordiimonadaceae bacterium]|nr:TonB-dependent siderophore receptor [Kordiimonadaceae bacterium]
MKLFLSTISSIALLQGVAPVQANAIDLAESTDIEEIIVTGALSRYGATKSAIPIIEMARSISVESEKQFRDKGALTLDDVLNYTSGVVGDTFGFSTRGDFPKVRGFTASEFRDGQQVLFGFYNNTRSDVYMLEQVEVLKGPASVLYGKGTPGGIVNAISKVAGPDRDTELIVDVGTLNRFQGAADLNLQLSDNVFIRFVGLARDSDTQVDFVQDDALIIMPSITYQTDTTSLTAMVEVVDRNSDTAQQFLPLQGTGCVSDQVTITPTAVCANATGELIEPSTFLGDPDFNRYNTNSVLVSILGFHEFTPNFSIETVARYKDSSADYHQTWMTFLGDGVPRADANGNGERTFYDSKGTSEQFAGDIRVRWSFDTGSIEHEVFAGIAYQHVVTDNDSIYISGTSAQSLGTQNIYNPVYGDIPAVFTDGTAPFNGAATTTNDYGFYISDQLSFGALKVNLGLRYDDSRTQSAGGPTQKDNATSFSAGLLYALDNGLSPYISFAESFEPVIGTDGFTNIPLKPREGKQFEVGLKYQPPGTRTYITLAYFDIEESNLPNPSGLVGQPDSQQEGVGTVKGVEIEAQTTIGDVYLEGNFTLLDTETAAGFPFSSIPEEQASAWLQYEPSTGSLQGFRFGAGVRYTGDVTSDGFGFGGIGPISIVTGSYVLADMMLGYTVNKWDFTLNLRNISDKQYYGTCLARGDCFPGEDRTIVARIAHRF